MSNGDNMFERLFKLWAMVSKMVLDGKRDPEQVCAVLQQIVEVPADWLEQILAKERAALSAFFGQDFDLAPFRRVLEQYGYDAVVRWRNLSLEPHFLPSVVMDQGTDFPGWKVKPEEWFWRQVAAGKILRRQTDGSLQPDPNACQLEGITILVDIRLKPRYDNEQQMFANDNLLGPIIEKLRLTDKIANYDPRSSRFNVSADEWEAEVKPALTQFLGVPTNQVRLERTIEANVIPQLCSHMPRKDDGRTNTWCWYEEYFGGASGRLCGGRSVGGGLAFVSYHSVGSHWRSRAVRPLVVLGS